MADNFLEKQMEDYRRGSRPVRRPLKRRGRVALIGVATEDDKALLRMLTAEWQVFFTAAAGLDGQRLAQQSGARYYPDGPGQLAAHTAARGETIDYLINHRGACLLITDATGQEQEAETPDDVQRILRLHS